MTRNQKVALGLVLGALIALTIVCLLPPKSGTSLAAGCPVGQPPSTRADLTTCLRNVDFDSVKGAGDEQRLMINPPCPPGPCRHGPLAIIQPEKKSHQHTDADLQEGRIIAKLFLRPGQTQNYPKLGLYPGSVTYWWVHQTSAGGGRSVYIRYDTGQHVMSAAVDTTFALDQHSNYEFKQALARWGWSDRDETAWGTCKRDACCR
jgi:hypothetical protein